MDIVKLNQDKNNLNGKVISKKEMIALLKEASVRYPEFVFSHLRRANVVDMLNYNRYRFQKEPILKSVVESGEKEASKLYKKYTKNSIENKTEAYKVNDVFRKAEGVVPVVNSEEVAIELLKRKGYKIFKYVEV